MVSPACIVAERKSATDRQASDSDDGVSAIRRAAGSAGSPARAPCRRRARRALWPGGQRCGRRPRLLGGWRGHDHVKVADVHRWDDVLLAREPRALRRRVPVGGATRRGQAVVLGARRPGDRLWVGPWRRYVGAAPIRGRRQGAAVLPTAQARLTGGGPCACGRPRGRGARARRRLGVLGRRRRGL